MVCHARSHVRACVYQKVREERRGKERKERRDDLYTTSKARSYY